jgi:hypothetical protein
VPCAHKSSQKMCECTATRRKVTQARCGSNSTTPITRYLKVYGLGPNPRTRT